MRASGAAVERDGVRQRAKAIRQPRVSDSGTKSCHWQLADGIVRATKTRVSVASRDAREGQAPNVAPSDRQGCPALHTGDPTMLSPKLISS